MVATSQETPPKLCRILSLDGGGAKGFYTLGVLREVESMLGGKPLYEHFDLIFGTSTGAIIAALLAIGKNVPSILSLYEKHVPTIMGKLWPKNKSKALKEVADEVFGTLKFTDVKTGLGIVATRWLEERPMIFKPDIGQAHASKGSFVPGFGCTIADAVRASCSAVPFFKPTTVRTSQGADVEVVDGGYCANNPALYAVADAVAALKREHADIRLLSIGVGHYPEPKRWVQPKDVLLFLEKVVLGFKSVELLEKTLNVNTTSMEQLRVVLFSDIKAVRISERFTQPELATSLLESDRKKLNKLYQQGISSFAKNEPALKALLVGD
jgi:patatin-like phospholipase/acyl hydrolase